MKCDQTRKKKLWCGTADSMEKHHLFSTQKRSFLLMLFDKLQRILYRSTENGSLCLFITRALLLSVARLWIGKSLFCPVWITAPNTKPGGLTRLSMPPGRAPARKQPHRQTALFVLSLKSQFLPLNVYAFHSQATCLTSWEPSAAGALCYLQEDLEMYASWFWLMRWFTFFLFFFHQS